MKKLNKTRLSIFNIFSIVGVVLLLAVMFSLAQPMTKTKADGTTSGGGVATHGGASSSGSSVSSGDFASISTMGYRIYLAENSVGTDGHFRTDTYSNLTKYIPLSVYTIKNWDSGVTVTDQTIHIWTPDQGIMSEYIAPSANFNDVFGGVFGTNLYNSSYDLPAVDLSEAIQDGNDFNPFINYCEPIKGGGLDKAIEGFKTYVIEHYYYSTYTANQKALYDELASKNVNDLMLVCEPVFICQSPNQGNTLYTIGLNDWGADGYSEGWGGGLYAQGAMVASRITNKLNQLYTSFTYNDIEVNPDDGGRWYGFFIYNYMNGLTSNKIGVGLNLTVSYDGDLKRNNTTSDGISTALSETMTAPSQENEASTSYVGNEMYDKALASWEGLAYASSSVSHQGSALYMSGWGFNNTAFSGNGSTLSFLPWEGAWYNHSMANLAQTVDSSMVSRLSNGGTDYVHGVFGRLASGTIDDIADKDMYISNTASFKLSLAGGSTGGYSMFYGDSEKMQAVSDYVKNNIKTTTVEKAVTAPTDGYAFGSTIRSAPFMSAPDFNSEFINKLANAFNDSGLYISNASLMHDMDAEANDNGGIKGQKTPEDVKESLARIEGATVFANPVNITQADRTAPVTVDGGDMTLSVTTLEKENKVSNYLGCASVVTTGGIDSPASNDFAGLGRDYTSEHPASIPTTWYINDISTGTIGSGASDQEVSFLLVWKNSDMTNSDYDFSKGVSSGATNITTDVAKYMTNNHQTMADEKSYSMIGSAFKAITGVTPLSAICIGDSSDISKSISLGSYFGADDNLTGLSALVITVSGAGDQYTETGGNLPADMLNVIAPSSWGLTSNQAPYSQSYSKRDWDGTERDWEVIDQFSGDLHNFGGTDLLYYNEEKGNFGSPEDSDKWFGYGERAYMSYAYILPRSAWGDKPTVANYIGDGRYSRYQDFAERMKFPVGDYAINGVTCNVGANVERIYPEALHDRHKFKCYVEWETRYKEHDDGNSWWEYDTKHASTTRTYNITSTMDKYTAMNKGLASLSDSEANTLYWDNEDDARDTDFIYASSIRNQSEDTIYLYPEVRMLMQYASGDTISSTDDVETVDNLYVMGEKLRSFKPVAMRGILIGNNDQFYGQFTSNTIADDSRAKELSKDNDDLPVVYAGGNINLHVDGIDDKIKLVSYAIDFDDDTRDSNRHLRFNSANSKYNPENEHKEYVNGVLRNLGVDVTLDINADSDGDNTKYRYHNFNTMMSQFSVEDTDTDSFKIYYKEGHIYTGSSDLNHYGVSSQYSELIDDIATEYNISKSEAKNMLEDSAMFKQLEDALEDGDDPANSSHEVSGSGNEDYFNTDHWYDEQTSVMCVRKYVTYVSVGDIALSDKVDITIGDDSRTDQLKQSGNRNDLFSNAMYGKFYVSMYLKNDIDLASGNTADDTQYQVLWEEKLVNNADFLISDATTNDQRN
ncbi:hypothetical protein [Clostridium beijerinckii]|uniref:hypothetical protein n=1 Tax=Clostridium beijerinckii TaxID=1520 RepID=UPI00232CAEB1|nr:hypothetical protein [Clostridium beijerinckii]